MRIALLGKGGSGKTTVAALLTRFAESQNLTTLAIDADINQNLAEAVGFHDQELKALSKIGEHQEVLKKFFRGTNSRIKSSHAMLKTTPPGMGSALIKLIDQNPIINNFTLQRGNLFFMATGTFSQSDLGTHCYHSKTGAVELILNHLIDKEDELIVVDMTAGIDAFASGLFAKFDLSVLVVEPTLRSIEVYKEYKRNAEYFQIPLCIVTNKIETASDLEFIKQHCDEAALASLPYSQFVKRIDKGESPPFNQVENETKLAMEAILKKLRFQKRDWAKFQQLSVYFHEKNCKDWANALYGEDLSIQIDPDFQLTNFLNNN